MRLRRNKHRKRMLPFSISSPLVTGQKIRSLKVERLIWRSFSSVSFFCGIVLLAWILSMFEIEIIGLTRLGYLALMLMFPLVLLLLAFLIRSVFGLGFFDRNLKFIPMKGSESVDWIYANAKEGTTAFFYLRDVFESRPGCLTRYEFEMLLKYIKRDSY